MRGPTTTISVTTVAIVAFALMTVFVSAAEAKRPGGDSETSSGASTGNFVFIAAGVAVIAGVTFYLVTRDNDDRKQESEQEDTDTTTGRTLDPQDSLVHQSVLTPVHKCMFANDRVSLPTAESKTGPTISPFVGLSQQETITLGLSLSF